MGAPLLFPFLAKKAFARKPEKRPNIVFIYADDQDFDEIEPYDADKFPCSTGAKHAGITGPQSRQAYHKPMLTPNISRLAKEGAIFTRFYITSPICTPSRYSTLTGRYCNKNPWIIQEYKQKNQELQFIQWNTNMENNEDNIAKKMKSLGYSTGVVGKWHNLPWKVNNKSKPIYKSLPQGGDPGNPEIKKKLAEIYDIHRSALQDGYGFDYVERIYFGNPDPHKIKQIRFTNLDWVVEGAVNFIDEYKDNPFFLYVPLNLPHGHYYEQKWANVDYQICPLGKLDKAPGLMPSKESLAQRLKENNIPQRQAVATYIDDAVGVVIKHLESIGQLDNTAIIYSSDHQAYGKNNLYEGTRVPFIMRWPGKVEPGTQINSLAANIDLYSTFVNIANGTISEADNQDGQSILPLLEGNTENKRESLILECAYSKALVTEKYKYIANRLPEKIQREFDAAKEDTTKKPVFWNGWTTHSFKAEKMFPHYSDSDQLYDLENDLFEQDNLAGKPEHKNTLEKMKELLKEAVKNIPAKFAEFK